MFKEPLCSNETSSDCEASLGIVNEIELTFGAMFIALLIWSLANYLHVSFNHLHMHTPGVKLWEAKFRSVSLRLGYVGNTCWAFLFFPVTRGSSLLPLVGLTSESSIKYHIWLGHLSTVLFAAHSIGFIIYWWAMSGQMSLMLEWSSTYVSNVAGVIAFVVSLGIWATSFNRIRRNFFEVFFYAHHLYILYVLFYILHVGVAYFCMILPGIFLFLIDRYLRFLQSRRRVRAFSRRLLLNGTMELTFSKNPGLSYNPTRSCLFMCQLYKQLSSSLDHLQVSTEGPYGPTSSHFLSRESLVMICGGSGIAPFISIIREIIFRSTRVVFLLQKRENSLQEKQIQNVEMPTPTSTPASWLCATEREIESLQPHQSLVRCTKVHFGARPDLKGILFDCKESDVGVLVCCPKSLRHEVAKICASALAENLHFDSISFSW
ncbi:ferric reduction oxidase 4-like [Olea europaea subsp. europaea]|uniref:Ferric reduction oxidase 4-like n=1 Tax=Olea europaea subsp. europaea TaxID=158383 RepID=A0A8S0Q703_OLEEU|nr:ferric reduction oxidase 4-like [Olea europaea subsp. europaea]